VSPRKPGRRQSCSAADAETRLHHARLFLEVAQLVADEGEDVEYASPAASLAVLAGIAASDAMCCKALGERSRGQDHRQAITLLEQVEPTGREAAKSLGRLLDLKDEAHYGLLEIAAKDLKAALRQASTLVKLASEIV
jgi:hypothetical protein